MAAKASTVLEARVMAGKELTQMANRRLFHAEKAAFAAITVSVFLSLAYVLTRGFTVTDMREMGQFGRSTFMPVSVVACVSLSIVALVTSTGIIMTEATGRRLDILRITPLSLQTIVLGKGIAVFARSGLVMMLLLPVLGAAQLFGGVSAGDIVKTTVMTLADVFLLTSAGLAVSAGARTVTDRAVRSAEVVFLWFVLTGVVSYGAGVAGRSLSSWPQAVSTAAAISPIGAWSLHVMSLLTWPGLAASAAVAVLSGLVFLRVSVRSLTRSVAAAESASEEPKLKDLLAGLKRLKWRPDFLKGAESQRDWAGTLVGSQLTQVSLAAVLFPLAAGVPQIMIFTLYAITNRHGYSDYPWFVAMTMGTAVTAMLGVQSCGAFAREKARHTAEILASTPAGGEEMIWWKGAAIGASQAPSIAICLLFMGLGTFGETGSAATTAINILGFASLAVLVLVLGTAFSVVSKSTFEAVGLMVGSLGILTPALYMVFTSVTHSRRGLENGAAAGLLLLGMAFVWLRQWKARFAKAVLCVAVAVTLASAAVLLGPSDVSFNPLLLPLMSMMGVLERSSHVLLWISVWGIAGQVALSAALIAGMHINFTGVFLRGARPKD